MVISSDCAEDPKRLGEYILVYIDLNCFRAPDVSDFVADILLWIRGKNVFIEEDCMIVNFGFVWNNANHGYLFSLVFFLFFCWRVGGQNKTRNFWKSTIVEITKLTI